MGANDPRGGAIFDPRGMIGRIYNQRTNGPVNAHLRSATYANKHV